MRSEAIWLVQFLGVVVVLGTVFLVGVWVGGRRKRVHGISWDSWVGAAADQERTRRPRRDLFAPEVPVVRGELTTGT